MKDSRLPVVWFKEPPNDNDQGYLEVMVNGEAISSVDDIAWDEIKRKAPWLIVASEEEARYAYQLQRKKDG